ncbi:MAG: hypothetical protein KME17_25430 [Cyanosarcina radialis HA8281-LM2]|nr:hypothetical protein [Cyanosarcina radialis HA8281-LM2]
MNAQLVDSIIQVVRALPKAEQKLLIERINLLATEAQPTEEPLKQSEMTSTVAPSQVPIDEEAWEVWRSLGDDAIPGNLENPSVNHDRYLYSKAE